MWFKYQAYQGPEAVALVGYLCTTSNRQRGVNRVVMAVRDLDAGRRFYESLLGATFHPADERAAEEFGVEILMSWDAGVELVAPIEGRCSHVEKWIDEHGEGFAGVVFAVADADESRDAAAVLGVASFHTLDYDQDQIDAHLQGRFSRHYEHFLAADGPLGRGTVLIGEFDTPPNPEIRAGEQQFS